MSYTGDCTCDAASQPMPFYAHSKTVCTQPVCMALIYHWRQELMSKFNKNRRLLEAFNHL